MFKNNSFLANIKTLPNIQTENDVNTMVANKNFITLLDKYAPMRKKRVKIWCKVDRS